MYVGRYYDTHVDERGDAIIACMMMMMIMMMMMMIRLHKSLPPPFTGCPLLRARGRDRQGHQA